MHEKNGKLKARGRKKLQRQLERKVELVKDEMVSAESG
jgi:hypothetical protein